MKLQRQTEKLPLPTSFNSGVQSALMRGKGGGWTQASAGERASTARRVTRHDVVPVLLTFICLPPPAADTSFDYEDLLGLHWTNPKDVEER